MNKGLRLLLLLALQPWPVHARKIDLPDIGSVEGGTILFDGGKARPALDGVPSEPAAKLEPSRTEKSVTLVPPAKGRPFFDDPARQKELLDMINRRDDPNPRYLLGEEIGGRAMDLFHPAFGLVEGFSDRLYDLMSLGLMSRILPGGLSRDLKKSPKGDSYLIFDQKFHEKEYRFLQRLHDTYPRTAGGIGGQQADPARYQEWQRWAGNEQLSVMIDALKDTILERYKLEAFGQKAGDYAKDKRHWDPAFLATAGIVGGAFLYLNGVHARTSLSDLQVGIDMAAVKGVVDAIENEGDKGRAAGIELSLKDRPFFFNTDWKVDHGQARIDIYGLKYRRRFAGLHDIFSLKSN